MAQILAEIAENLYAGEEEVVARLTRKALDEGLKPLEILGGGLRAGMDKVGADFRDGELFVPEVILAARSMHAGLAILRPLLTQSDIPSFGKIVIGTVGGDLHDIGKSLVAMMLQGGGFTVVDVGVDVSPDAFVEAVKTEQADLLGLSALLTTTMPGMRGTIDALIEAGLRDQVKVIIGGAPVTQAFSEEIGADGYAPDAASAVELARSLVGR